MKSCTSCKNLSFSTTSQHQRVFPSHGDRTHHHARHRNKIPETAGHFYEQPGSQNCSCKVSVKLGESLEVQPDIRWHQKLHNNTTPDDVGICKAGNSNLQESIAEVANAS